MREILVISHLYFPLALKLFPGEGFVEDANPEEIYDETNFDSFQRRTLDADKN